MVYHISFMKSTHFLHTFLNGAYNNAQVWLSDRIGVNYAQKGYFYAFYFLFSTIFFSVDRSDSSI